MDPVLTDEQRSIAAVARRFAAERVAPGYQDRDRTGVLGRAVVREMGALGLIAPELPDGLGGHGLDCVTSGLITEAIAYADINVAYCQILASLNGKIIAEHANPDLAREWIERLVTGDALVALGLTEPRGGSDAASLALSARRVGDSYILRGEKSSISIADQADAIVLFARTGSAEDGARGVTAFLVQMVTPGITAKRYDDLGSRAIGRSSVFFDDVEVPAAWRRKARASSRSRRASTSRAP
mgnify:CR=1 FL=1